MQLDLQDGLRAALAGRYEVLEMVGRGGTATVWRARDLRHEREVAIKVLHPDLARAVGGERFLREIGIVAQLGHPNILPLLDSGAFEVVPGLSIPWYSMPFVRDETLRARLVREGPLPVDVAVRYARDLCAALTAAHAQGYIHRDIKPENILLVGDQAVLADFGIARAVTVAAGTELSSTGLVVGTPAYMSPEQSVGSERLDARSDLYSLGVVLYEMLAGHPPFTGATPQAISARHQFEPPPPIRVVRPAVQGELQAGLERALAKLPADRFASVADFDALLAHVPTDAPPGAARNRRRSLRLAASIAVSALAIYALVARIQEPHRKALDPDRYVVLPPEAEPGPSGWLTGANASRLLWEGLRHWTDMRLVDPLVVASRLSTHPRPLTLDAAREVARGLRAGRLIWGQVYPLGDSVVVRASVYSAQGDRDSDPVRSAAIMVAREALEGDGPSRPLVDGFRKLAQRLVVPDLRAHSDPDLSWTTSLTALRAMLAGDSALERFDLKTAERLYQVALAADSNDGPVRLRLARTSLLSGKMIRGWRPTEDRIANFIGSVTPADREEARALLLLDAGEPHGACHRFRKIVEADSLSFFGWYGLGICQLEDRAVIPDSTSPSRWRFRSSVAAGIGAVTRALELASLSHAAFGGYAIERLSTLLYAEPNRIRLGAALADSSVTFGAYPAWSGDSLAFVPYPIALVTDGSRVPASRLQAVNASRQLLLQVTSGWLADYPQDVPALTTYGLALEIVGALSGPAIEQGSALAIVDRLRLGQPASISLGAWRLRLLLKLTRFTEARLLADTLLHLSPRDEDEREALAAVAGMTGRIAEAAQILSQAGRDWPVTDEDGRELDVAPGPRAVGARLLAFAAGGGPTDSLHSVAERLRQAAARGTVPPSHVRALLLRPVLLAYPALGVPVSHHVHAEIARAISQGDTATARGLLDRITRFRVQAEPGTRSWGAVPLEARLYLMVGDTNTAVGALRDGLENLAHASQWITRDVAEGAGIPRAMRLLATLLRDRGDSTASTWSRAAEALTGARW
ncbi:MAG TPA: serine/threonine-protein kinase [Gemmatimonadales bacterium]|nr:serine/threonine-protein kinase [Gemmatimonadales bacterium]